jgi:proteasome lid subunit RPN8/RPN11
MIVQPNSRAPSPLSFAASSCIFPDCWTPEVDRAARRHAHENLGQEVAGMVKDGLYVPFANVSPNPETEIGLSDQDMIRLADADAFFHSHPRGPACPSERDMRFQVDIAKPCLIYVPETNDLFAWGDMLARPALLGRAFRHGVFDCYAAVRDWYREHRDVTLPEGMRGWEWWSKGQDLYADNFARAGFVRIPLVDATQPGDLLMFQFNYKVLMHAAVVHSSDLLFHHTAGRFAYDPSRLSGYAPRERWARLASAAVRYAP